MFRGRPSDSYVRAGQDKGLLTRTIAGEDSSHSISSSLVGSAIAGWRAGEACRLCACQVTRSINILL
jgi:hypothetical protein